MGDCIFCKIAQKEAGAELLVETDLVISFMDIQPRAIGHCLVIPKKHAVKLAELDDETASEVLKAARDVTKALQKALNPDAFTIGINDGEAAGQVVPHLHVNIIPRFNGDGGAAIHAVVHNPPSEGIQQTADRIRAAL